MNSVVYFYIGIFLVALALAIWRRKTFSLAKTLMVSLIVGVGFTALVHFSAPPSAVPPTIARGTPSELIFTLLYLVVLAGLLVYKMPSPEAWKGHFLKENAAKTAYKLLIFVLIPLAAMRLLWGKTWSNLGFAAGDVPCQLLSAAVLIFFFGGFNLLAGGAAAPIRRREFSLRQVLLGMGTAFAWNVVEVGLVEEFFFRAFLQTRLIEALGSPLAGICAASLLFGLAHAPGIYLRRGDRHGPLGERPSLLNTVLYAILALSPTGWFTGLLFWRTQSLLAPILVHAAVDAVAHASEFIEGLKLPR